MRSIPAVIEYTQSPSGSEYKNQLGKTKAAVAALDRRASTSGPAQSARNQEKTIRCSDLKRM